MTLKQIKYLLVFMIFWLTFCAIGEYWLSIDTYSFPYVMLYGYVAGGISLIFAERFSENKNPLDRDEKGGQLGIILRNPFQTFNY